MSNHISGLDNSLQWRLIQRAKRILIGSSGGSTREPGGPVPPTYKVAPPVEPP